MNGLSPNVVIMTCDELESVKAREYQRGVNRGKFEASYEARRQPVARNCKHWKDGRCETCGVQHQYFEVGGDFKCPHFVSREGISL